jgi:hypothetical protein
MNNQPLQIIVLPEAEGQSMFCPELLTAAEAIRYLRLDVDGPANPQKTLAYYRDKGLLQATRVGKRLRYRRCELEKLLEKLTERTNR